ncbi:MAG: hypothetical protein ACLQGP_02215 [Isosphaeraceae bacterium]
MLLELYDVNKSLLAAGIIPGKTDNRIQTYPKRPGLEVRVDGTGCVVRVALLRKEQLEAIRKFECSTGSMRESTPGFNADPLFRMRPGVNQDAFDAAIKALKNRKVTAAKTGEERRQLVENLKALCEPNWDFSEKSKLSQCLSKGARILREQLTGASDGRLASLVELLKRSEALEARSLQEGVANALISAFTSGESVISPEDCVKLLFSGGGSENKKKSTNQSFSLILELDEASAPGGPANHEVVWKAVNNWLVGSEAQNQSKLSSKGKLRSPDECLGVFGEAIAGSLGKMPERNLPRLGKVKLFSLSDQTPCQARYGLIESDACPVGRNVQSELASALQWITEKERENGRRSHPEPFVQQRRNNCV